ncbi:hypothetical protein B566_EDAN017250 [Ephemera danica]|nr:hypothetical protein B566_EDAN017250 [Ephemera danica]
MNAVICSRFAACSKLQLAACSTRQSLRHDDADGLSGVGFLGDDASPACGLGQRSSPSSTCPAQQRHPGTQQQRSCGWRSSPIPISIGNKDERVSSKC